jgi:HSP20 family protein
MLVKWQPINSLLNRDSFFDEFFNNAPVRHRNFEPRIDVKETEKSFVINAELPGLSKDDFKLTVENNVLTLSGEKKSVHEEKREGFYRSERSYGAFQRSFRLTDSVDSKKIKADYNDGILTVEIPKSAKAKPQEIEVKVN